jgi:hypothetical protein
VTVSGRVEVDEASADHPVRTLRPAAADAGDGAIDIDVELDELAITSRAGAEEEEEETTTMELNPELRARIDQMAKAADTLVSEEGSRSSRPPPTRPLRPPRRR